MTDTGSAGAAAPSRTQGTNYHTHALTRGLVVLEILADGEQPMTLATIHERSGLPKSTLVRLLAALCEGQFLVRVDDRPSYRLGHKVLDVARAYLDVLDISRVAAPHLDALARATRQTVNLGVRDGAQVVHVAVALPQRTLRFDAAVGDRAPLHATSLGKALLAALGEQDALDIMGPGPYPALGPGTLTDPARLTEELVRTRDRGWALDDNEHAEGLTCIAVPLELGGAVVAALSVSGPSGELGPDAREDLVENLRGTARTMLADPELADALVHSALLSRRALPTDAPASPSSPPAHTD
ncbi:IclR family transcriptional regulator [Brachybacterium huguangmaarense]